MLESACMTKKQKTTTKAQTNTYRTPIVTVMGHVDHGKTTLLDSVRGARVADSEHGGITQNTRAHQVAMQSGNKITFIDTPGHEAFSAMRSRGAEVTDFVLLVVAADDGAQNQTKESIKFAKETNTPIIVAINKVDLEGVKVEKIKRELTDFGVVIEEYGGDVLAFPISGLKKQGLEELLEGIELLTQINDLQPNQVEHGAIAKAYVLESSKHKHLGALALCICKGGSLNKPIFGATASQVFKVRSYLDQDQKPLQAITESDPFWVTGLKDTLPTGEYIYFFNSEAEAQNCMLQLKTASVPSKSTNPAATLTANQLGTDLLMAKLIQQMAENEGVEQKVLNVIVRASTQGTLEAVLTEIEKLGDDNRRIKVLESSTGEVSESDIRLAKTAKAIVISFQQKPNSKISSIAKQEKVILRNYEVIYEMLDELGMALDGMIGALEEEVEVARARVKQVFTLTNGDVVAGCEVISGTITRGYQAYVERPRLSTKDEVAELARGKITSIRILKNEVKEAKKGQECGIIVSPKVAQLEAGDEIVAFKIER